MRAVLAVRTGAVVAAGVVVGLLAALFVLGVGWPGASGYEGVESLPDRLRVDSRPPSSRRSCRWWCATVRGA